MNKSSIYLISVFIFIYSWGCQSNLSKNTVEATVGGNSNSSGSSTPRGLINKSDKATPGYVFFSPLRSDTTYLINNDGAVVHTWKSAFGPSGWVYLKENGNLVRGGRDPEAPVFGGGGQGGWIQEFSWNGEMVWEYKFSSKDFLAHHDVAIMPNGNILVLAWESKTTEKAIQAGRKPDLIPKAGIWPDMIVELKPQGKNGAKIVWEWHLWDHIIQDHDDTKANFGDVAAHPELLDINSNDHLPSPVTKEKLDQQRATNNATTNDTPENQGSDLFHTNAINYNADLDQIVLSSPALNEIFIIDHSTTTKEAADHEGGRWGKGGDILYRWGNPQNYKKGDSTQQKLGGQHDVQWIGKGLPGEGNLLIFNNHVPGSDPGYSSVMEIQAPLNEKGYILDQNGRFGPENAVWSYVSADSVSFFAPFISGAHRLPNGNTFITAGPQGRFFEVNPEKEILWEYWTPYAGYVRMPDGTTPQPVGPFTYATFRATFVSADHPAIVGKNLKPLNPQPAVYKEEERGL